MESATFSDTVSATTPPAGELRLGFVGLGWIGRNRLAAVANLPHVRIAALADPSREAVETARALAPQAALTESFDKILDEELDGLVIATPSALHAEQTIAALRRGMAVYCQKPLARTAAETAAVLAEANAANRLLGVDYCYRHLAGVDRMRQMIQDGALGQLFHVDLVFHNAYGPDKSWFYELSQSGGGCLIDLGSHLIDLAMWMYNTGEFQHLQSRLYRAGKPLRQPIGEVEDAALAEWTFARHIAVRLACSWKISAGCDAQISASFYGSEGSLMLQNVNGSFYDFTVTHCRGTQRELLAQPPDDWGGRSIRHWLAKLSRSRTFEPAAEAYLPVAQLIDGIYQR